MLPTLDSRGRNRADHMTVLSTFLCWKIFTMNSSGGKKQTQEVPTIEMDLCEVKKKKRHVRK